MKKLTIATALALSVLTATAADVSVSTVRDMTTEQNGYRVTVALPLANLSATKVEGNYVRWAIGHNFPLTSVGPVALSASLAGVYHNTQKSSSEDGYGFTVGGKATMPVTKNVNVVASIERFTGQSRISNSDGNTASLGLNVKF